MTIPINKSIALLIGAGAVKNAWLPIQRALQPIYYKKMITAEAANCYLARLVYLLRWASKSQTKDNDYGLSDYKKILEDTKYLICNEIKRSQEQMELTVQDQFNKILTSIIASKFKKIMLVTTNWDTVFEDTLNKTNMFKDLFDDKIIASHIHGTYLDPKTLYLPTEVCEEPYRVKDDELILGSLHLQIMEQLSEAEMLIIYGLSISPLDAELTQILAVSLKNDNIQAIIIIDPNFETVRERINILLPFPNNITLIGYKPDELENGVELGIHN